MELDVYTPCPVHPEKKIKFCCGKEIASELNQIFSKFEARQPAAALDSLNRLIEKVGPKDCLQSLKVQLLASLGEYEQAGEANEQFLAANPNHSVGLEQRAVMLANQGRVNEAFEALQTAMDNLPGSQIPVGFAMAFLVVGTAMYKNGLIWPARAHVEFAKLLKPNDEQIEKMAHYIMMACNNLFLKRLLLPVPAPNEETPWKKRYENAAKAARRGQFRKAVELAKKALEMEPESPLLIQNLAIHQSSVPNSEELVAAWKRVAEHPSIQLVDRVEAEVIVQSFSDSDERDLKPIKLITFEFEQNYDAIHELALTSKRLVVDQVDETPDDDGGPPPRAAFLFLDRNRIDDVTGLSTQQIPKVLGQVLLYGKQTDRLARFELVIKETDSLAKHLEDFQAIFQNQLKQLESEPLGEYSVTSEQLQVSWHLPPQTERNEFQRLEREHQMELAHQKLATMPLGFLGFKTLKELSQTPQGKIQAQAVIEKITLSMDGQPWQDEFRTAAYAALGLEPLQRIKFKSIDEIVSPFQAVFAELDELSNEHLRVLFMLASGIGNISLMRRLAERLLRDEQFSEELPKETLLMTLAQVESDDDRCFDYIAQAKKTASVGSTSFGQLLVMEFEQRLMRGRFNGMRQIMVELQKNYLRDRNVSERLGYVLAKYGLITPDGRVMLPPEQETTTKSGLWTPDAPGGGEAEATSGAAGSKLWVLGQ
jgi:hypothetical protein